MLDKLRAIKTSRGLEAGVPLQVSLVPPEQLVNIWGQVIYFLEKGEKFLRGYYTQQHVYDAIVTGRLQLWIGFQKGNIKIIALTQLDYYPDCVSLRFVFMSGERGSFKKVLRFYETVEQWAVMSGATKSTIIGRDGWQRLLERLGYKKQSIVLVKDLVHINTISSSPNTWRQ